MNNSMQNSVKLRAWRGLVSARQGTIDRLRRSSGHRPLFMFAFPAVTIAKTIVATVLTALMVRIRGIDTAAHSDLVRHLGFRNEHA